MEFLLKVWNWLLAGGVEQIVTIAAFLISGGAVAAKLIPGTYENSLLRSASKLVNMLGMNFGATANNPELAKKLTEMNDYVAKLEATVEAAK